MRVGAIVTVPGTIREEELGSQDRTGPQYPCQAVGDDPLACQEILGETLLQRTLNALGDAGIRQQTVLVEESGLESLFPSRLGTIGKFFSAWEASVERQLDEGAEILFLIRLGAYLDLDFARVLDFHRQSSGVLTQVYDHKKAFDVALVSTSHLRGENGSYRGRLGALIPYHKRYSFTGYTNPLREPRDLEAVGTRRVITPEFHPSCRRRGDPRSLDRRRRNTRSHCTHFWPRVYWRANPR